MSTALALKAFAMPVWSEGSRALLPRIEPMLSDASVGFSITESDLRKQALLHLPRFTSEQLADLTLVAQEIHRLANKISARQSGLKLGVTDPRDQH
jgi:hypothetical protein